LPNASGRVERIRVHRPHADGCYAELLTRLAKTDLLIQDDWGIAPLPTRSAAIHSRCSRTAMVS